MATAGATNTLTDVEGVRVGHATRISGDWLTGTTVVLAPLGGAVGGVDVRGGGPGTRETDLLDPRNAVTHVDAVVLSGGSAYGLAAADGVMQRLRADGRGFPVAPGEVVPIVPSAVVFDLGRGGDFTHVPDSRLGAEAYDAAGAGAVPLGVVGAGTGAVAGGLKGGIGSASAVVRSGFTIAAIAVVNAVGSAVDPRTGVLYGVQDGLQDEFAAIAVPDRAEVDAWRAASSSGPPPLNTTLAVIATNAKLTKAQCAKVSGIGHDGMARALRPAHTMFDGDTVFTLATGAGQAPDVAAFHELLGLAAGCVSRAIAHAMLAAETTVAGDSTFRSYRDVFASAVS